MTTATKPRKKKENHVGFRNGGLFCFNCGGSHKLNLPIVVSEMTDITKGFERLHKNCKPTWQPPVVDQSGTEYEKAKWWISNGERGRSSECIFYNITKKDSDPNTVSLCVLIDERSKYTSPSDPDDFRRCYLLLQTVPEWKEKLHLMKSVSPVWEKLVENWTLFTGLLEEQLQGKKNDLHTLMKNIGC